MMAWMMTMTTSEMTPEMALTVTVAAAVAVEVAVMVTVPEDLHVSNDEDARTPQQTRTTVAMGLLGTTGLGLSGELRSQGAVKWRSRTLVTALVTAQATALGPAVQVLVREGVDLCSTLR